MAQKTTPGRNGRVHEVRKAAGEPPATRFADRSFVFFASAYFEIMIPPFPHPRSIKSIPPKTVSQKQSLKTCSSTRLSGRGRELLKESERRKGGFEERSRPIEGCRGNFPKEMARTSFNDPSFGDAIGKPKARPEEDERQTNKEVTAARCCGGLRR